jgi:hypothetical protein
VTISAATVVDGEGLALNALLEKAHRIPEYQRDFAWNREKVRQLWRDLLSLYDRNTDLDVIRTKVEGYFLGPTVVIEVKNGPDDVVDGQQRLTTLTSLMAVLAESVRALPIKHQPPGLLLSLDNLVSPGLKNGVHTTRLSFADSAMDSFFRASCVAPNRATREKYWGSIEAVALLKRARGKSPMALLHAAFQEHYTQLEGFLGKKKAPARAKRLALFSRIITECVVILRIAAGSYSNAYTIFESLNFRGVQLSQADLIKNELLKSAAPSQRDHILARWNNLKEAVEEVSDLSLPDAVYLCHLSRFERVNASQLYEDVKRRLGLGLKATSYLDDTVRLTEFIAVLKKDRPSHWTADAVWMLDDIFFVLSAKLAIPFLLAAYERKGKSASTAGEFEGLVRLCMNFTFRYMKLLDGETATFSRAINEAALAIAASESHATVAKILIGFSQDHLFEAAFRTYSVPRVKLAFFVVYWLERHLMKHSGAIPLPHGAEQHLEHIMPKTPSDSDWKWATSLKKTDEVEFADLLSRVGNLLPMPAKANTSMKNKGIKAKLAVYSKTALVSPKQVGKYLSKNKWDASSIDKRQVALAKIAILAWKIV